MTQFRLGGVPGVSPGRWMRVWSERVPSVPLQYSEFEDEAVGEALARGDVDAALLRLPVDDSDLHVVSLYAELQVVVFAKDHELAAFDDVTAGDLAGETLVSQGSMTAAEWMSVVASGAGIAVAPMSIARAVGGPRVRARVVVDAPPIRVGLTWLRDRDSPLHQELAAIVRGRTARSSRGAETVDRGASTASRGPAERSSPTTQKPPSSNRRQPASPAGRRGLRPPGGRSLGNRG